MKGLEFRVLGPLEVVKGGEVIEIPAAKLRSVLAAFVLNSGRLVPFEGLVEAVWCGSPPRAARVTLHTYLSKLRGMLQEDGQEPVLLRHPGGYALNVAPEQVDLHRFEAMVRAARADREAGQVREAAKQFRRALSLWRGHALCDIESDTLASSHGVRLEEKRVAITEEWIDLELALGEHLAMLPEIRASVKQHPLREKPRAQLMLALYRLGRQADALKEYQTTYRLMRDETGLEPGPALQALHRSILNAELPLDPPAAGPPRRSSFDGYVFQLPPDVPGFVGRAGEIQALCAQLTTPGAAPVACVVGMPGIGKTALAVHVAHEVAPAFPDGVVYVDLASTSRPVEPEDALADLIWSLSGDSVTPATTLPRLSAQYRSLLARRKILVVLEDARDEAQVRPLLPATTGCAALVTSRSCLRGLDGSHLTLDLLSPADSAELALRTAGEHAFQRIIRGRGDPSDMAAAVDELVATCGRLPLAVRLAAARLAERPDWTAATLCARLREPGQLFAELSVGDLDLTRSIAASVSACSETERALLAAAAGLAEGFRAVDLAAILPDTSGGLDRLIRRHLVAVDTGGREPRYSVHPVVAAYVRHLHGAKPALNPRENQS